MSDAIRQGGGCPICRPDLFPNPPATEPTAPNHYGGAWWDFSTGAPIVFLQAVPVGDVYEFMTSDDEAGWLVRADMDGYASGHHRACTCGSGALMVERWTGHVSMEVKTDERTADDPAHG
jgi:hypothetical protein